MTEMSPAMLGASLVETEPATDFTMLLGTLLKENQITLEENSLGQPEEAKSPIERLLEWMTEEVAHLKVPSDEETLNDIDLNSITMEQFPEWETSFSQIAGWLEEKIDFQLSGDQQNAIVEISKQIFQALHDLKPTDWIGFPQEPIFTLLKMEKSLQSLAKQCPVPAEEMGQLIELDDLSQALKEKIEQLSKLELFREAIPKAFTKMNETEQSLFLPRQGSHFTNNQINMANTVEQGVDSPLPQDLGGSQDRLVRMVTDQLNLQKPLEQQPAFRNFVRELSNIMGRSNFNQTAHTARLTIRLYPEELGSLRVELLQKDGIMTARFLASSSTAKEMLDVQMHSLRQAFSQQNIQVERIEVSYGDSSQLKYTNHQHGQNEQGRENRQAFQEDTKQADGESNFQETMNHILFEKEV